MKKTIFGLMTMLAFFAFSCQNADTKKEGEEQAAEQTEQTADENAEKSCCEDHVKTCDGTMTVNQVLEDYENLAEKEITVCGKVTHTCVHSGKRMFLSAENSEDILVVTTEDSKFEEELVGQKVVVTGKIAMTPIEPHEEDGEHQEDAQHAKAHEKTFVLEAMSCKTCTCKHTEEETTEE